MDADYELKRGDTSPPLQTTLTVNGSPQNLSNADTVTVTMKPLGGGEAVSGTAQVVSASDGVVAYHWNDGDTDSVGLYFAEWVVTYGNGREQSFPNDEFDLLYIKDDL